MSNEMVKFIQATLTDMYKRHEMTPAEYESALEDTRLVKVTS